MINREPALVSVSPEAMARAFAFAASDEQAEILRLALAEMAAFPTQLEFLAEELARTEHARTRAMLATLAGCRL